MANAARRGTEPSQEHFLQKRGKTLSWPPREKGIVYNPDDKSLRIRRIKKIEKERSSKHDSNTEYMCFDLPSSNIITIFENPTNGQAFTGQSQEGGDIFIGRLNLQKLSIKDQFSRFIGQLKTLYIVKSNLLENSGSGGSMWRSVLDCLTKTPGFFAEAHI